QPSYVFPSIRAFEGQARSRLLPTKRKDSQPPSEQGAGGNPLLITVLGSLVQSIERLQAIPPGQVVQQGLRENPDAATSAVTLSFSQRTDASSRLRNSVNVR